MAELYNNDEKKPAVSNTAFMQEFNAFQQAFYTDIRKFGLYTKFDFQRHGFTLLYNMSKGLPSFGNLLLNMQGINWSGCNSQALIIAVQRVKFCNNYGNFRVPSFVYFKQEKIAKVSTSRKTKDGLEFSNEIRGEIMQILFIDIKTYEYLKFSDKIQNLGKSMLTEFVLAKDLPKVKRATKPRAKTQKKS